MDQIQSKRRFFQKRKAEALFDSKTTNEGEKRWNLWYEISEGDTYTNAGVLHCCVGIQKGIG